LRGQVDFRSRESKPDSVSPDHHFKEPIMPKGKGYGGKPRRTGSKTGPKSTTRTPRKARNMKSPARKPKTKTRVGTASPGKPYYSSKSLGEGYEERYPSAAAAANLRKRSPFGKASPRAAALDVAAGAVNLFRDEEGSRGARHAETVAKIIVYRKAAGKKTAR